MNPALIAYRTFWTLPPGPQSWKSLGMSTDIGGQGRLSSEAHFSGLGWEQTFGELKGMGTALGVEIWWTSVQSG